MLTDKTVLNLTTSEITLTKPEKTCVELRKEKYREQLLDQSALFTIKQIVFS